MYKKNILGSSGTAVLKVNANILKAFRCLHIACAPPGHGAAVHEHVYWVACDF